MPCSPRPSLHLQRQPLLLPPCPPRAMRLPELPGVSGCIARSAKPGGSTGRAARRFAQPLIGKAPHLCNLVCPAGLPASAAAPRWRDRRKVPNCRNTAPGSEGFGVRVAFDGNLVRQLAQFLRELSATVPAIFVLGSALPLSKKVPDADSSNSMRSPSAVTVISIWFFSLSSSALARMRFCSCSFSSPCCLW